MSDPTIGVGIVATERDRRFEQCVNQAEKQADAVSTVVDYNLNLSEARNRATETLDTDVYAFIDADAYPDEDWIATLRRGYRGGALAVGGPAELVWNSAGQYLVPSGWEWIVGGGPYYDDVREIRNTYGTNFSMRAHVFDSLGGFDTSIGKGSSIPHGEETDLARRMNEEYGVGMVHRPNAVVYHYVDGEQLRPLSLLRRAYRQGYTKALIGADDTETSFVDEQLPSLNPWEYALFGAAGVGYLRGGLDG